MGVSKAFVVVPHNGLLEKLQYYGIKGPCLGWNEDFLKNRSQRVIVDSECSEEAAVTPGVLKGSVLRPILFLAVITNMREHVNTKYRLFTNDSIIYREMKSNADCD